MYYNGSFITHAQMLALDAADRAADEADEARRRDLVKRLDLAIERGDRLAIATLEAALGFGYADRFIRES